MKMKKEVRFKRKDGTPTYYAFVCGHVMKKTAKEDHLFRTEIEIFKEPACNIWQIRGFKFVKGSISCDRLFWESAESMTEAIKLFNKKIKEALT